MKVYLLIINYEQKCRYGTVFMFKYKKIPDVKY